MNKNTLIDYLGHLIDYIGLKLFFRCWMNTLVDYLDNLIDYFFKIIDYLIDLINYSSCSHLNNQEINREYLIHLENNILALE